MMATIWYAQVDFGKRLMHSKEFIFATEEQRDRFRIEASERGWFIYAIWHKEPSTCQSAIAACERKIRGED